MQNQTFQNLGLSSKTLKSLEEMGFVEPSPIQAMAIPVVMEGKDMIGQAQTGTGKTAAFGIPIIEKTNLEQKSVQGIVLVPTRELAIQVAGEIQKLAKYHKGFNILPVYGGQAIDRQIRSLRYGVNLVIGTPGRVLDHIRRGTLKLSEVRFAVLDEADEMLDMGFLDDIRDILSELPEERQTVLFSATMPPEIMKLAKQFQKNAEIVKVAHQEMTVPKVKQIYYETKASEKPSLLIKLLDMYDPKLSIVFVNTRVCVEELREQIQAAGYSVEGLHGEMKQTQRDYVMKRFRGGGTDILIATDVAARGIDVDDIDMVFNYDLPQDEEYYVHRIGRTARAGREGMAISFVTMREFRSLREIERYTKVRIERKMPPTLKDIREARNQTFIDDVRARIDAGNLDKAVNLLTERLSDCDSMDIAAALTMMVLESRGETGEAEREEKPLSKACVRVFVKLGRKDGLIKKDLIRIIEAKTGIMGRELGEVALLETFSFVHVPEGKLNQFLESMNEAKLNGRRIKAEVAEERAPGRH